MTSEDRTPEQLRVEAEIEAAWAERDEDKVRELLQAAVDRTRERRAAGFNETTEEEHGRA